jgi:hypothetical protein
MYANEVEKGHIERESRLEMVKTLAKSETQPLEAAQMRPYAQVRPLDVLICSTLGSPLMVIGIVAVTFEGLYHSGPSPLDVP